MYTVIKILKDCKECKYSETTLYKKIITTKKGLRDTPEFEIY